MGSGPAERAPPEGLAEERALPEGFADELFEVALCAIAPALPEAASEAACTPPPSSADREPANTAPTSTVATDQVTRPWAVSRKNTSCVCVPCHRVRSRPAMYPPRPAEIHCVTMSQMAVVTVNVVADTPRPGHGDISANPRPDPNASKISDTETATNAPAMIAAHEAADLPGTTALSERFR